MNFQVKWCFRPFLETSSPLKGAIAVADPGFPRGGGRQPIGEGTPTYDIAKISQKLHEIERIFTGGGIRGPSRPLR